MVHAARIFTTLRHAARGLFGITRRDMHEQLCERARERRGAWLRPVLARYGVETFSGMTLDQMRKVLAAG